MLETTSKWYADLMEHLTPGSVDTDNLMKWARRSGKKLAPNLAAANAETAKQISDLAGKKTSFERDREGSLGQVRALLGAVEKVELELAKKVAGDDEKKALRNYRKDEIPLPYRKAVASYYEELSKDQQK